MPGGYQFIPLKVRPLVQATLPLDSDARNAIDVLKKDLATATLQRLQTTTTEYV